MKAVLYDDLEALKLLHKTGRWLRLGNRRKVRPLVVRTNHMTITANGMTQLCFGVCATKKSVPNEQTGNKENVKRDDNDKNKVIKCSLYQPRTICSVQFIISLVITHIFVYQIGKSV